MRRAAVSIGANLAEGCGRRTAPELARFVRVAMGVCKRTRLPSASMPRFRVHYCCGI
ncbi:MAG: four helix bundle protein [Actinomycetota bacterium]